MLLVTGLLNCSEKNDRCSLWMQIKQLESLACSILALISSKNKNKAIYLCAFKLNIFGFRLLVGQKRRQKTSLWALGNYDGLFSVFSEISWSKQLIKEITGRLMNNGNNHCDPNENPPCEHFDLESPLAWCLVPVPKSCVNIAPAWKFSWHHWLVSVTFWKSGG